MKIKLNLARKGLLVLCLTLVFELALLAALSSLWINAAHQLSEERKAQEIISHLEKLSNLREKATIGLIKQIYWLHDSPDSARYHDTFSGFLERIPYETRKVKELVNNDPVNGEKAQKLEHVCLLGVRVIELERQAYQAQLPTHVLYVAKLQEISDAATAISTQMVDSYKHIQEAQSDNEKKSSQTILAAIAIGVVANVLLAFFAAFSFIRQIVTRIETIKRNSLNLAAGKPLSKPLSGDDEIVALDTVFHNMAEVLRESARKERALIDNAVEIICSIDADGRFASVNQAVKSIGYSPADLVGLKLYDLLAPKHRIESEKRIQNIICQRSSGCIETQLSSMDGNIVDVVISVQWSRVENALFCVMHDVSARKEAERRVSEFHSMVSHELRTPLTSIRAAFSLMESGLAGEIPAKCVDLVSIGLRESDRLIRLVNDILDLKKLEAAQFELSPQWVSARGISAAVLANFENTAIAQNVRLTSDFKAETAIYCDADRITQVLVNLIGNAIKYSPSGTEIQIRFESSADSVRYSVIDSGPGIAREKLRKLFNKFVQLDSSSTRAKGGTGLGLAICKAIVEQHGGQIGVDSTLGEGSTFWFTLPIVKDELSSQRAEKRIA